MKIKVDENICFDGWEWDSNERGEITEAFHGAWEQVERALAKEMAETVRNQFREDGIDIDLINSGNDDDVRATIWVTLNGFTVGPDSCDALIMEVPLGALLDEMIATMSIDARELIPDFRAMLAKLEAIPNG